MYSGEAMLRLVLVATLVLAPARGEAAQGVCAPEKQTQLSLKYSVNGTGHPQLKTRLEQPEDAPSWHLDILLSKSKCGELRKPSLLVLQLSLSGSDGDAPNSTLDRSLFDKINTSSPKGSTQRRFVPPGFIEVTNYGYYKRLNTAMDWVSARGFCRDEGGVLWLPKSQEEMDALLMTFPQDVSGSDQTIYVWVGATDIVKEGTWITELGESLDMATTITHRSNGGRDENCLIYIKKFRYLADWECARRLEFFCKLKL